MVSTPRTRSRVDPARPLRDPGHVALENGAPLTHRLEQRIEHRGRPAFELLLADTAALVAILKGPRDVLILARPRCRQGDQKELLTLFEILRRTGSFERSSDDADELLPDDYEAILDAYVQSRRKPDDLQSDPMPARKPKP
jgi:hypothetical protein